MGYDTVDHAVKEYRPAGDLSILGVEYEARIRAVPSGDFGTFLIPCHAYSSTDHYDDKAAIMHRKTRGDTHEAAGAYMKALGGENDDVDGVPNDANVKNKLQVDPYGNWTALVEADPDESTDGVGTWTTVGSATDTPHAELAEIDFMTEAQWDGSWDFPMVNESDNRIIIAWVLTNQGYKRPGEALRLDGDQQGDHVRISASEDSWGRYWLHFWWE